MAEGPILADAIPRHAVERPDAPAILSPDGPARPWGAVAAGVRRLAGDIAARGIGPGDTVALLAPGGPAYLTLAAVGMTAARLAPLDATLTDHEALALLSRLRPAVVLLPDRGAPPAAAAIRAAGVPVLTFRGDGDDLRLTGDHDVDPTSSRSLPERAPTDVAVIIATSGTTSAPKLVPLTFANLRAALTPSLGPDDRVVSAYPAHSIATVRMVASAFTLGAAAAAYVPLDRTRAARDLAALDPTFMHASPPVLLELARLLAKSPLPQLSRVQTGAMAITPERRSELEAALGAPLVVGYGMTETTSAVSMERLPNGRRAGSSGLPHDCEVAIRGANGEDLPPGEAGDIVVRGDTVFAGYLDDPAATDRAFLPGGWFRTGDLGYRDADGFLFVLGRADDLINRGGVRISPEALDELLATHPDVVDAAVFTFADDRLGQEIGGAVVLRPGIAFDEAGLRRWLFARRHPSRAPRRLFAIDAIPRTSTGKVRRGILRDCCLGPSVPLLEPPRS